MGEKITKIVKRHKNRDGNSMSALLTGIVGRLAGDAIKSAVENAAKADDGSLLRLDDLDETQLFAIVPGADTEVTLFSQSQIQDMGRFLRSVKVEHLIQSVVLLECIYPDLIDYTAALDRLSAKFVSMAQYWGKDSASKPEFWAYGAQDLWLTLLGFAARVSPGSDLLRQFDSDELDILSNHVTTGVDALSGGDRPAPIYLRDLVRLAQSPSRLYRVNESVSDICRSLAPEVEDLKLNHARDFRRFSRDSLFVNRQLLNSEGLLQNLDEVLPPNICHTVITGDPGVGKTTLVEHVCYRLTQQASTDGKTIAPLLIRCRDYARADSFHFVSMISERLTADYHLPITPEVLTDLLTLGQGHIIFDGIDEVLDVTTRRSFVQAIENFSRRFPLCSILVTGRSVGYEHAALTPAIFNRTTLQPFTLQQIEQYVDRWFAVTEGGSDLKVPFLRESESVLDLRRNPLLLSLLCVLYTANGYIPRNRRSVYRDCAELLFMRWDSVRHIEQPYDHRQYGPRLMGSVALWFYRSQAARGGVEERQLRQILRTQFMEDLGAEYESANRRAAELLEYCADRAWLLSSIGTNQRNERLYAFTHTTFMEYYAAEAIVLRAASVDEAFDQVIEVFTRNPSSVLVDVLIQSADDKWVRAADTIGRRLTQYAVKVDNRANALYVSLCLRLATSSPTSARLFGSILDLLRVLWAREAIDATYDSSYLFFSLPRDPRDRVQSLLSTQQWLSNGIISRWARFFLIERTDGFDDEWKACVATARQIVDVDEPIVA